MVSIIEYKPKDNTVDALTMQLESFIGAINNNTKPIVDGRDGIKALDVALKIIDIIKQQKGFN